MVQKTEVVEVIFDKCPVCKKGKVIHTSKKKFFNIITLEETKCIKCNSIFKEREDKEEEKVFELDLSESREKNKYGGQSLKISEWKRGLSDLDFAIKNNKLPNLTVVGLKIILQDGEKTHWYSSAVMMEERAIRKVQSYRVGGRGFSSGTSTGESHGELRKIDSGNLLLTNKRIIFNGSFKHLEYKLDKLSALEEFEDGFEIGVSNRQKLQTFMVEESNKWVVYIKIALKNGKK